MQQRGNIAIVLGIVWMVVHQGYTSDVAAQDRILVIETNQPEALVYADSTFLGRAASGPFHFDAEAQRISVLPPTVDIWSIPPINQDLVDMVSDTVTVQAFFKYYYRFDSIPSGAIVFQEKEDVRYLMGRTPLNHVSDLPLEGDVFFDLENHLIRSIEPEHALWNRHLVLLETSPGVDETPSDLAIKTRKSSHWLDYAAVGTALIGGVLAVHFKTKADNRFDQYNEKRDPSLKADVKRLDVYSGVALGAMQVGLGVLAFRLVF